MTSTSASHRTLDCIARSGERYGGTRYRGERVPRADSCTTSLQKEGTGNCNVDEESAVGPSSFMAQGGECWGTEALGGDGPSISDAGKSCHDSLRPRLVSL